MKRESFVRGKIEDQLRRNCFRAKKKKHIKMRHRGPSIVVEALGKLWRGVCLDWGSTGIGGRAYWQSHIPQAYLIGTHLEKD